jgi:hypothetical protein
MFGYDAQAPFYTGDPSDIIPDDKPYPIRPSDIDISGPLLGAFGAQEIEAAAARIIEFCLERNQWHKFTYEEINNFFLKHPKNRDGGRFAFWGLINTGRIIADDVGFYYITKSFVQRCVDSNKQFSKRYEAERNTSVSS